MGDEPLFKGIGGYGWLRKWWMRWKEDPKMKDLELQVVLKHRDEAPRRKASRSLSKLPFLALKLEHRTFAKDKKWC